MSMTVYLSESIVLCALFCGWGFGWFGKMNALNVCFVAIGCWVAMEAGAVLWLKYAKQGPFESLMSRIIGSSSLQNNRR